MSKKFKGKLCTYCRVNTSTRSGDHVFAREFFLKAKRDNLPKVPSCESCNNEKSKLEHYLTAVLPFGGQHPGARENLREMVPGRLAKNLKLHRTLTEESKHTDTEDVPGVTLPTLSLPFNSEILYELFRFIVKGLLWHHWRVALTELEDIRVISYTQFGETAFSQLILGLNGKQRVEANLGDSSFCYEGIQGTDYPELSFWSFSIYGGLKLSGDPDAPDEEAVGIGAITAKKDFLERPAFAEIFG